MTHSTNKDHLLRQYDLIPEKALGQTITIIGAGAVGSWTSLCLAKMGFARQKVIDMDTIEIENMNCQFYPFADIGEHKAKAIQALVQEFTHEDVAASTDEYKGSPLTGNIVISAVDSMAVRKLIFENCYADYLVDPRMSAETLLLHVVNMKDQSQKDSYVKTLYTDGEAMHERCTAKATIYCANILSGLVCKAVKNISCGEKYTKFVSYDMALNDFDNYVE